MSTTAGKFKFKGAGFFLFFIFNWSGVEAAYPASILQHWSWKHPACELRHLVVDNNPKFLQVWVRSTHQAIALHLRDVKACINQTGTMFPWDYLFFCFLSHSRLIWRPCLTDQSTDFFLSVRSRSRCGFDHCRCLIVCELLYTSLSCHYITDLQGDKEKLCFVETGLYTWSLCPFQGEKGVILESSMHKILQKN